MKILYIVNARIPTEKAHGVQIMKMCEAFSKIGCEVELILPRRINPIKKDPFSFYNIEKKFKIKKLPCLDLIFFDKYLGHLGLWIESLSFVLVAVWFLLFKKKDMIFTRDKFFLFLSLFKKNFIFEAHNFPQHFFLYKPFLKKVKKIITITSNLKKKFLKEGIKEEKLVVLPDGVDIKMFDVRLSKKEARKRLGLPLFKKIVVYTGHLYSWKGAQILAQSALFLPKDIEVYFVGGTQQDVERFKSRFLGFKNIKIIGWRPYSEIPVWLKASDVLVLPNSKEEDISQYYTSPLKLFEYMTSQRPIIASDLPSLREILNHKNSFLVEPQNPKKLAEKIIFVFKNKKLAQQVAERAFQDVQNYTWEKRAQKIINLLQ